LMRHACVARVLCLGDLSPAVRCVCTVY
jgi:hypothetical protein